MIDTMLQFSGGKDSRALLHMFKDQLESIIVAWCDSGAAHDETVIDMQKIAKKVPHFLIVRGNQPKQVEQNGYPSDVVPINYTPLGRNLVKSAGEFKVQSTFDCCSANVWKPLHNAVTMLGIKTVIRGQRNDEVYSNKSVTDGKVVDGITYRAPLANWTEAQVFEYLKKNAVSVPDYYKSEGHGRDCWSCTGYLSQSGRIKNLPVAQKAEVMRRLEHIHRAVEQESVHLRSLVEAA